MRIINAAAGSENTQPVNENPAQHHSLLETNYHQEFGFQTSASELQAPEVPEIKVNGVLIDEAQVLAEVQYHPADSKRAAMIAAAEYLIIQQVIIQRAQQHKLFVNEQALDTPAEYDLIEQLMAFEAATPQATEEECLRFYQHNQDKFKTSPIVEARHILLAVAPDDVAQRIQLKDVAQQLIKTLESGEGSFTQLVKAHSACPSKEQQGNLGQLSKGQTVPEFEKALFKAEEGLLSYPVETRYGFHIVMIDRKIDGKLLPYEYVKDKVVEYLNEKVRRKATAQYIQTLIDEAEITGFDFNANASPLIQ